MDQGAHTFDRRLFIAYVVCSLTAVFYLPTLVPLHPTASDSYVFAYNNRVGILLLLLLVAIGTAWTKGLNLQLRTESASQAVSTKDLAWSLLAVLCGCLAMYMLAGRFGGFGESSYEIDRAWLLAQGKTPYLDFEWPFGAALLYGPLLLHRLLFIDIVQAYYLFWTTNCLVGTLLLRTVINLIDYPTRFKRTIFLLLFGAWFFSILNMGTHYTLLRYTLPLLFILVVHRLLKGGGAHSRVYAALLAIAFTAVLLLISPETAIAHAFACVCIFPICAPGRDWKSIAALAGMLLGLLAVFLTALKLHILDTVMASGGGADSFPIAFAPHILLFFAALFVCACYAYRRLSERRIHDNTIGPIAFSVPMIAAALGRCDPGHVVLNGLGIFLASMFYLSHYKAAWKWCRAAFVVFLILLPSLSGALLFLPSLAKCEFNLLDGGSTGPQTGESPGYAILRHAGAPTAVDLSRMYPSWQGAFLAPFGYKPNGLGTYLSSQVDYGHFEGLENAYTVDAIQAKITEIGDHPEKALLLPDHFESSCQVNVPVERTMISLIFSFPYFGKAVHTESARQPLCNYILARYRLEEAPAPANFSYGLWRNALGGRGTRLPAGGPSPK